MYGLIYKVTNLINGKCYIGKTSKTIEERRYEHEYEADNIPSNKVFHKALRKYSRDSFEWEIIDYGNSDDELSQKEMFWIDHYKSYIGRPDAHGYNMTLGGEGGMGYRHTEEAKAKMSEHWKGIRVGENHPMYGRNHTEEARTKMSKAHKGKKLSDKTRKKMSKRMQGVVTNAKPVVQLSLNGDFIAEYESAKQAMIVLGVKNASNITECCRGRRKTAYKYKWLYKENYKS